MLGRRGLRHRRGTAADAEQVEQAVDEGQRVGRAAGDVELGGELAEEAALDGVGVLVGRAADGAGAGGDDELGGGHAVPGEAEGLGHVGGDWSREDEAVGVARGGDPVDAPAAHVKVDVGAGVELELAAVAAAGGDLAQLERAAEQLLEGGGGDEGGEGAVAVAADEGLARGAGHLEVVAEGELVVGADVGALATEHAEAEVEAEGVQGNGAGRAEVAAGGAALAAGGLGDVWEAAEALRAGGAHVGDELPALGAADADGVQHGSSQRSVPAYDRSKLLLQIGKSEISLLRTARARPNQFCSDGSWTL